eukprot:936924-Pelagomonas_calceolata.AAC.1
MPFHMRGACRAIPMLIWFTQCPVILGANFDFYEASPMVCAVAGLQQSWRHGSSLILPGCHWTLY